MDSASALKISYVLTGVSMAGLAAFLLLRMIGVRLSLIIPAAIYLGGFIFSLLAIRLALPNTPGWILYFFGLVWVFSSTTTMLFRQVREEEGPFKPVWCDAGLGLLVTVLWLSCEVRAYTINDQLIWNTCLLAVSAALALCLWLDLREVNTPIAQAQ